MRAAVKNRFNAGRCFAADGADGVPGLLRRGEALLDALLTQARQYSGQENFRDDVCLVGIEIERLTGS